MAVCLEGRRLRYTSASVTTPTPTPSTHALDPQVKINLPTEPEGKVRCLEYRYPGAPKQPTSYPLNLVAHTKIRYFEVQHAAAATTTPTTTGHHHHHIPAISLAPTAEADAQHRFIHEEPHGVHDALHAIRRHCLPKDDELDGPGGTYVIWLLLVFLCCCRSWCCC